MKEIKKWATDHKVLTSISVTVFFLFGLPLLIHLIVTLNWGIGFITPDNQDAWIGFYGAIIGGGATLGAVWWSIIEQRKQLKEQKIEFENQREEDFKNHAQQRREELAVQFTPMIVCLAEKDLKFQDFKGHICLGSDGYLLLTFFFKSSGRGEVCDLDITITNLDGSLRTKHIPWFPSGEYSSITTNYIANEAYKNEAISFTISFNYTDLYGVFAYENIVKCDYFHSNSAYLVKNGNYTKTKK